MTRWGVVESEQKTVRVYHEAVALTADTLFIVLPDDTPSHLSVARLTSVPRERCSRTPPLRDTTTTNRNAPRTRTDSFIHSFIDSSIPTLDNVLAGLWT